jgi:hypothetical protein
VNFNEVPGPSKPLTTSNVNQLGSDVWLTSNDDVTTNPSWILGTKPDASGKTNGATTAAVIVSKARCTSARETYTDIVHPF